MKITVKIFEGEREISSKVFGEGSLRAGRSEFCDIVLQGDSVSRSHVELRVTPASVYMTNMSTAGRVKVNGERVETAEIKDGDTLQIGSYRMVVIYGDENNLSSEAPADAPAGDAGALGEGMLGVDQAPAEGEAPIDEPPQLPVSPALSGPSNDDLKPIPFGKASPEEEYPVEGTAALVRAETVVEAKPLVAKLVFTEGIRKGEELLLETYEVTFGRSRKADVFLDDEKLSRQHAKISRVGMGYRLIDLNSRNGTFVNGMRVLEHPLNSFDVIELGSTKIKFLIHDLGMQEPRTNRMELVKQPPELTASVQMEPLPIELQKPPSSNPNSILMPVFKEEPNKRIKLYVALIAGLLIVYFLMPSSTPEPSKKDPGAQDIRPGVTTLKTDKDSQTTLPALPNEYKDLTSEMQKKIEGHYQSALRLASDRKDFRNAIVELRHIHEVLPYYKNSKTMLEEYHLRFKEQDAEEARKKANQPEKDLEIYLEDGMSYLKEGDFDRATEAFRQALNIDPRNETAQQGLKAAEYKVKNFADIPPERDPEQEKIEQIKALFEKAISAFKVKSYQEAIETAEKIRQIELKGNTQYLNEAKQIIDRAKMLQKEEFEPFLIQAKEKYAEGDYNSARDLCEEMLKRDPAYDDAKDLLNRAKKQLNHLAKEAYTTGYILESMNRIEEAKQYWNRSKNYVRPGDDYYNKVMKKLDQYQ